MAANSMSQFMKSETNLDEPATGFYYVGFGDQT